MPNRISSQSEQRPAAATHPARPIAFASLADFEAAVLDGTFDRLLAPGLVPLELDGLTSPNAADLVASGRLPPQMHLAALGALAPPPPRPYLVRQALRAYQAHESAMQRSNIYFAAIKACEVIGTYQLIRDAGPDTVMPWLVGLTACHFFQLAQMRGARPAALRQEVAALMATGLGIAAGLAQRRAADPSA